MGTRAVAVRQEERCSAYLDRYPDERDACPEDNATGQCAEVAGDGAVLSAPPDTKETSSPQIALTDDRGLHQLWFALPHQQRIQFGGHFSEMLLRAVRHETQANS